MTWQHVTLVGIAACLIMGVVRFCGYMQHGCDAVIHEVCLVSLAIISGAVGNAMPNRQMKSSFPNQPGAFYESGQRKGPE